MAAPGGNSHRQPSTVAGEAINGPGWRCFKTLAMIVDVTMTITAAATKNSSTKNSRYTLIVYCAPYAPSPHAPPSKNRDQWGRFLMLPE